MMNTTTTRDLRRRLGGASLVAAPALLVSGALIHPKEVPDAGRQLAIIAGALHRWYVAHLLYVMAMVVLVPAVLSLGRHLRAGAPRLELWGTGLAVVGLFSAAGLVAIEGFGGWQLAQESDRAAATQALDHLTHSAGVVVPFGIVGLTLSAGLVVLAVGLRRTATVPAWTAWTLGAGAALLGVGLAGELHAAFVAGVVGIAVALAAVGVDDLGVAPASDFAGARSGAPLIAS
jgi:hypothetical protein